jgi:hypothetical protein
VPPVFGGDRRRDVFADHDHPEVSDELKQEQAKADRN